jgi:SAM-dependent methyltransferase
MVAAQHLLPLTFSYVPCLSFLDVGCGVGPWVAVAQQLGVPEVFGIDGDYVDKRLLCIPPSRFLSSDLTQPLDLHRRFDLVISMEVAEHIVPSSADIFIDNLTRHSDAVLFSAAIPGQGGTFHVNEQWPEYWQAKFAARGFQQFDVLRGAIWEDQDIPCCYRQNAYLYIDTKTLSSYPALQQADSSKFRPIASIHPELFTEAVIRPRGLRRLVNELPAALRETLKVRGMRLIGRMRR